MGSYPCYTWITRITGDPCFPKQYSIAIFLVVTDLFQEGDDLKAPSLEMLEVDQFCVRRTGMHEIAKRGLKRF